MNYTGMKVLVMGLGLHGGGLTSAGFMLKRGAEVTVTDLRDEKTLKPSIEKLDAICQNLGAKKVRYVLTKHETEDFKNADIVIKNPGVRQDNIFLQSAKKIETDISLFLAESPARLFAVTGTKGKSGTSAALHWILSQDRKSGKAYLGGNITVSPLTFLDDLTENDDVVLELSSFQLGDLRDKKAKDGSALLKPKAAILTTIMADHLDRYASMDEYIDDKRNIYRGQDSSCVTIAGDDSWGKSFHAESKGKAITWLNKAGFNKQAANNSSCENKSCGWIENNRGYAQLLNWEGISEENVELVPQELLTPGEHQRLNLLCAALAAYSLGTPASTISKALQSYKGIEHRLEFFHEKDGIRFYNDSAATIPEAAAACIDALCETVSSNGALILVTGGTDKNLDFSPLVEAAKKVKEIILIAGSGSDKLAALLNRKNIPYKGPFNDLDKIVRCAAQSAINGDIVALSPGCASFSELFLNEFDRGRKWKEAVMREF